jgi:competence protein ComEC
LGTVLAVLHPAMGFTVALMADLLAGVHAVLATAAATHPPPLAVAWSFARWAAITLAVVMLLAPPGLALRKLGVVLLAGAHWPAADRISQGEFTATLLDVGQGLSMVVQTRSHTLVYDTGARYRSGFNMADVVLVPYLRQKGISELDMLILSHGDNDHAGAAVPLVKQIPALQIREGEPWRNPLDGRLCRAGERWRWDGVEFRFIQPEGKRSGNNASCVLLVEGEGGRLLVPGDIEKAVEKQLYRSLSAAAPVDVVVAPHHGSRSSSSADFVAASRVSHVLFPVGAFNRYGFPREEVVERWRRAGAQLWRTDTDGAITLSFDATRGLLEPQAYSGESSRYWHRSRSPEVGL